MVWKPVCVFPAVEAGAVMTIDVPDALMGVTDVPFTKTVRPVVERLPPDMTTLKVIEAPAIPIDAGATVLMANPPPAAVFVKLLDVALAVLPPVPVTVIVCEPTAGAVILKDHVPPEITGFDAVEVPPASIAKVKPFGVPFAKLPVIAKTLPAVDDAGVFRVSDGAPADVVVNARVFDAPAYVPVPANVSVCEPAAGAVNVTLNVPDPEFAVPLAVVIVGVPSVTDAPSIVPVRAVGAPLEKVPLAVLVPAAITGETLEIASAGCPVPVPRNADRAERVAFVSLTPSFNVTVIELLSDNAPGRPAAD